MKTVTTISVGIPAYNESANIKQLLQLVLSQKGSNFQLQNIYVLSDGSSDATVKEVLAVGDRRIKVKDDKKRIGKSARLEELFRLNTSDVFILMDADITINDDFLFSKLLNRVDFKKIGIAAINARPLAPRTFFERTLDAGIYATKMITEQWDNGDNYLSFKGCFLALSKDFVMQAHMPAKLVNNDAYLYFFAKKCGFKATYVKNCAVYYRSPVTLNDHIKQSSRFAYSQAELLPYFKNIQSKYNPPKTIVLKSLSQTLFKKHLFFVAYLGTHLLTKMKKHATLNPTWSIAGSTKQKIA